MVRKFEEKELQVVENMRGGSGKVKIHNPWSKEEMDGCARLVAKINIEPGGSIGYHVHEKEFEIYYILKGTGIIEDNGVKKEIKEGDSIITRNGEGHAIYNTGNNDLELFATIILN